MEDRNHYIEFIFEGSEEDVKKMMGEVKKIVSEIAPEAKLTQEIVKK